MLAGSGKCDAFEVAVPVASSYFELGRLATGPDHRHEATLRFQQSERVFARASEQAREQGLGELADRLREEAMSAAEQASGAATNSAGGTSSAMPNLLQQEKDLRARQWESWASHLGRI
ncbi:hypothetical protein [Rhodococcus sp. T7]|uniref:hypothetical protein n=1 Tax=Rhodococcus sp. T7 TaxID=627444 RepID=UPI00135CBE08|nr:hypothetical protein [Rhodococcus sp. T7]